MPREPHTRLKSLLLAAALACAGLSPAVAATTHPDFTGVWTWYVEPGQSPFARGPQPALPFLPDAKAKVDQYNALMAPNLDGPSGHCLGAGMPGSMLSSGGYPMEIVQRPEQITVVYEAHAEIRRIYLAGREIAEGDRVPDRNGYSFGHWEGDTLVVETTSLKEQVDQRYAHSDQARVIERYHLAKDPKGGKMLIADMTMTDPGFYTQPVTTQKKWAVVPNGHLLPYECNEPAWLDYVEQLKAKAATK